LIVQLDDNDQAATRHFAQAKVLADVCAEKLKDVGPYVGTAFTARDAMSIVDALGQGPLINYYGKKKMLPLTTLIELQINSFETQAFHMALLLELPLQPCFRTGSTQ
jgi:hypothetical protein